MGDNVIRQGTYAMTFEGPTISQPGGGSSPIGEGTISLARVEYVLLDDSDKEVFKELGGWKSIGAIKCRAFTNNNDANGKAFVAYPIDPNATKFPIKNELVLVIKAVTGKAQDGVFNYDPRYYYIAIVPGFNSVTHNSTPNKNKINASGDITGIFRDIKEINKLIKAPGDIVFEGRSGNSLRLGATIEGFNSKFSGKDRDPILIITNNRVKTQDSKIPDFESISRDGTTVAMLSPNQSIGYSPSSLNFDSYKETVQQAAPSSYVQPKNEEAVVGTPAAASDSVNINNAKDTPYTKLNVVSPDQPSEISNQSFDDSNLPDSENTEFYKETDTFVFTKDIIQYGRDAEEGEDKYENNVSILEIRSYSDLPDKIRNNKNFQKFITSPGVKEKVEQLCKTIKCSANDLYVVMYAETAGSFDPSIQNKLTNATGLIQFIPSTAKGLGTTVDELKKMSYLQQLVYVEKYYKYYTGKNGFKNVYDLYSYTIAQICVGKPPNWVFTWKYKKKGEILTLSAEEFSSQNPAIAKAANKKPGTPVTIADFYKYVNRILDNTP